MTEKKELKKGAHKAEHKAEHKTAHSTTKHHKKDNSVFSGNMVWILAIAAVLILFNQIQLFQLNSAIGQPSLMPGRTTSNVQLMASGGDLSAVDVNKITSTPQAVAAIFDLSQAKNAQDVMDIMVPTGVPDYGAELGISFDDPVKALAFFSKQLYPAMKTKLQQDPEKWARYISLASNPRGVSCEFCCGVGPLGITPQGELRCGCAHNPAAQAVAMYLIDSTDYSDAEVLREVMRWKTLYFPRKMVEIGLKISGGDASVLADVPTMVGGC